MLVSESRNEAARCAAARGELCRIENGIGNMAGHIDNLVNWWIRVEALLDKVNENVTSIRASKGNKIRFEGMHSGWGAIKAKYLEYKSEVMAEQSTTRFKQLAFSSTGTGKLIDAARNSFVIIEPWSQVESNNAEVQAVLRSAMQEAKAFYRSIDQSLQTAQAGYSFAQDAELLCDCLLKPKGTHSVEELTEYIEDMQRVAQTAHSQAKAASDMFRGNRQNFFEITKGIPLTIANIRDEEQMYNSQKHVALRSGGTYGKVKVGAVGLTAASVSAVGAIGITAVPAAMLVLPVALPVVAVIAGIMQWKKKKLAAKRETQSLSCKAAMEQLQTSLDDLSQLGKELDVIAEYWGKMDAALQTIRDSVETIQADRVVKLRITQIKGQWTDVKDQYMEYKTGVARLKDFFPASKVEN